jgi:histidyl-tRNA synthetase
MKVEKCKGMRDLLPPDMEKFRLITDVFLDSCYKWGYQEVRTPTLEYLHLFTSAGTLTPGMLGKVYSFLDWDGWSGERVVLRPDATIPVARLYHESLSEKELAKLFYIANTFIFEETGRQSREKWQLGAELIGLGSPLADVELIALAIEVLEKMGLGNVELRLSHAGLTRGFLRKAGLDNEQQNQVLDSLLDGDDTALAKITTEKPQLEALLALQGKSSGFVKNLVSSAEMDLSELKAPIDDFVFIADTLQSLDIKYEIDIASVRGFEYYTGMIFQLFVNGEKVGGGGRYDDLIPTMGGKATSASGFALYLDRLMQLVQPQNLAQPHIPTIVLKMETGSAKLGFSTAKILREAGFTTKLYFGGKGPGDGEWHLEISNNPPSFVLTDVLKKKRYELNSPGEVLKKLKGEK